MFIKTNKSKLDFTKITPKCLIQISKFARAIYNINGTVLKLQDNDILEQITQHCSNTDNHELHTIYTELQLEIMNIVCDSKLDDSLLKTSAEPNKDPTEKIVN